MIMWFVIAILFGLALILSGRRARRSRGLGQGRTLDLDTRTLYSTRYGLAGRPDRIIEGGIPEEWKSSLRVYKSHIAQLAVYFDLLPISWSTRYGSLHSQLMN